MQFSLCCINSFKCEWVTVLLNISNTLIGIRHLFKSPVTTCLMTLLFSRFWTINETVLDIHKDRAFKSHKWPRQNFFSQYQYNIKQISYKNKERYQLGDYKLIQYQILQTNITRKVWQTVRRVTNEILGVKGLKKKAWYIYIYIYIFFLTFVSFFIFMIFQRNVTIKNVCKEDSFLFLTVILKKISFLCRPFLPICRQCMQSTMGQRDWKTSLNVYIMQLSC